MGSVVAATVLIVGADVDSAQLMEFLLRDAGYATAVKANVEAVVEGVLDNCADLIICDLDTPDAAAFTMLSRLQGSARWPRVPVIGVTRMIKPGDHERMKVAGFAMCLHKPIEPEIFVSQVDKFLAPRLRRVQPITS